LGLGCYTSNGDDWGSWYYGEKNKKLKTGNIVVRKTGNQYIINYQLFDRVGSKISGVYTGTLDYYKGTASSVTAANVKGVSKIRTIHQTIVNKSIGRMAY
jgi:hypothetical protein